MNAMWSGVERIRENQNKANEERMKAFQVALLGQAGGAGVAGLGTTGFSPPRKVSKKKQSSLSGTSTGLLSGSSGLSGASSGDQFSGLGSNQSTKVRGDLATTLFGDDSSDDGEDRCRTKKRRGLKGKKRGRILILMMILISIMLS